MRTEDEVSHRSDALLKARDGMRNFYRDQPVEGGQTEGSLPVVEGGPAEGGLAEGAAEGGAAAGRAVRDLEELQALGQRTPDEVTALSQQKQLVAPLARETVEVSIKYAEALVRQERAVARMTSSGGRRLPDGLDYASIGGLSGEEVVKKLSADVTVPYRYLPLPTINY